MDIVVEGKTITNVPEGADIEQLMNIHRPEGSKVIAAKCNHRNVQLSHTLKSGDRVSFIDIDSSDGVRIYKRSLQFLCMLALHETDPNVSMKVGHPVNNGVYCTLTSDQPYDKEKVRELEAYMHALVDKALPIEKVEVSKQEALKILEKQNRQDRLLLLNDSDRKTVTFYRCNGYYDYFFSCIVSNTSMMNVFSLQWHEGGLVIVHPVRYHSTHVSKHEPSQKLYDVFAEFHEWGEILGIQTVGQLNNMVKDRRIHEMILVCEELQSKKISEIADEVTERGSKLVLISGPSSSGKTTFSKRLAIALRVNGIHAFPLALDNYFKNQSDLIPGPDGQLDLEHLDTMDLSLLNAQLKDIFRYQEVMLPRFDFRTKRRDGKGQRFVADEQTVILMEGIHGLNPELTKDIPDSMKYKIYISALATMNIDNHVRVSTTDNRLIRRMVRDKKYRNTGAEETLMRWPSVRAGEKKWIFPYQEESDIMFNSALYYEMSVLKPMAEQLLQHIDDSFSEFSTSSRLLDVLSYFCAVSEVHIPSNSLLREFIGDSIFRSLGAMADEEA